MRCAPVMAVVAAMTLLGPPAAAAQDDPRLVSAVRAAQEGRGDSARAVVQQLLAATPPTDTLYPQVLYAQAMVTSDAGDMRRLLQQVAVEYGASNWADDALLRLVMMDYAIRNLEGAARNLERLRLDYGASPLLPQAAYWAGRTYFDQNNSTQACRWLTDGMGRAGDNLELKNQLGYLFQRCPASPDSGAARADSTTLTAGPSPAPPPDSTLPQPPSAAPAAVSPPRFRVQVAAVVTPGAADAAAAKVEKLGLPAVIVRERGLYKVRAGAFATREAAQAAVPKLKAALGGSPFIVPEP